MYRWLGCRGCISDCVTVPLDQVVAIWNRYQTVLRGYKNRTEDMSNEKCKLHLNVVWIGGHTVWPNCRAHFPFP